MYALLMLVAAGCMVVVSTIEPGCENCGCCVDKICDSKLFCTNGCVDGIWGNKCYNKCPANCAACTRNRINHTLPCTKCSDGKYLGTSNDCSGICPQECVKCSSNTICSECNQSYFNGGSVTNCSLTCPINCLCSERRCESCKPGYYDVSNNCHSACPLGCSLCKSADLCDECKPRKYGVTCEKSCSRGCSGEICDRWSGECTCKSSFTGAHCNECIAGRYGFNCELNCSTGCSGGTCDGWSGNCSCKSLFSGVLCNECTDGKHGEECKLNCSYGCAGVTCDKQNGDCMCKPFFGGSRCEECVTGKYGAKCELNCSFGCSGETCKKDSGECTCKSLLFTGSMCNECVAGKYGNNCDKPCSISCKNNTCHSLNGYCDMCESDLFTGFFCEQCQVGLYGTFCNDTCPAKCANSTCLKDNGNCISCKANFIGDKCDDCIHGWFGEICSDKCLSSKCDGNCDRKSGNCLRCKAGFYGHLCENECSKGCRNDICEFATGNCLCKKGFSGDKCCIESSHCFKCVNSTECETCEEAFYGTYCLMPCRPECVGGCDRTSGECVSCLPGLFGDFCNNTCSETCTNNTDELAICNRKDGYCRHGCDIGFHGNLCTESCEENCVKKQCHQSSGYCALGCKDGYRGQTCVTGEDTVTLIPVAVGVSAGVIVIAAAVIFVLVLRHRRLNKHNEGVASNPVFTDAFGQNDINEIVSNETIRTDHIYGNDPGTKLSISQIYQYIISEESEKCASEFKNLEQGLQQPCTVASKPENKPKNRYRGLCPYDHSRVHIQSLPNFFINASYINGYQKDNGYIASLGPTAETTNNYETFWVMVWYHQSDIIVMLTNLMERSGMKCEKYWPATESSITFGELVVDCNSVEIHAEYTERIFTLSKGKQNRTIRQLHYTAWPDKSVPESVTSLIEFRQRVVQIQNEGHVSAGPVIVHCSAGVGRTGTYIALDRLTEEAKAEGGVNVFECVQGMREQRVNMVQTDAQYIYLYKALVHSLTFDSEAISADEFPRMASSLNENIDILQQHFRKLHQSFDEEGDEEVQARERNESHKHANRTGADIPGDCQRPRLHLDRTFNELDYINAVYVNSFERMNQFIVAQTPLPETLSDFVTLIFQENCSCIVSMEDMLANQKTVGSYLPPVNQDLTIGKFKITSSKGQTSQRYQVRKLTLTKLGERPKTKEIFHFEYKNWNKSSNTPDDPGDFIQFVKEVEKHGSYSKTDVRPILVHCLNGAEKSGLFCTIWVLLEKMEAERQVSVLNTVRQIRLRRKTAIPNVEQLRFCYLCVSEYLNMFSTYTNFATEI